MKNILVFISWFLVLLVTLLALGYVVVLSINDSAMTAKETFYAVGGFLGVATIIIPLGGTAAGWFLGFLPGFTPLDFGAPNQSSIDE